MRDEDLGIINGRHTPDLTAVEQRCLNILLIQGKGPDAVISQQRLAELVFGRGDDCRRELRTLINHLIITHGISIMCRAGKGGGHYLPGSENDVNDFFRAFHKRSMTGLIKASRGKKASFVEIVTQLSLGFDDAENRAVLERLNLAPDDDPVPAWVQVVTTFLDRIAGDPRRYATEIRKIQQTYGDIFVPREKVRLLKEKTAEFQKLLREIAQ